MPSQTSPTDQFRKGALLLREAVELLTAELSAIANRHWEELPELKKKKAVLACRLRESPLTAVPVDRERFDLTMLMALVTDLEELSRQKIQAQIELVGNQIFALQDQHLYWRECQNISFQKYYGPVRSE